jgi:hypothetical protein
VAVWTDAVRAVPGGVALLVEATAGARDERVPDGFNPWRGRLGVRVREPAQDGRANEAIVRAVAAFFGVPAASVHLDAGHLDTRKQLTIAGMGVEQASSLLSKALEE